MSSGRNNTSNVLKGLNITKAPDYAPPPHDQDQKVNPAAEKLAQQQAWHNCVQQFKAIINNMNTTYQAQPAGAFDKIKHGLKRLAGEDHKPLIDQLAKIANQQPSAQNSDEMIYKELVGKLLEIWKAEIKRLSDKLNDPLASIVKEMEKNQHLRLAGAGARQGQQFGGRDQYAIDAELNEALLVHLNRDTGESFMRTIAMMLQLAGKWNLEISEMVVATRTAISENDAKRGNSLYEAADICAFKEEVIGKDMLGIPDVFWSNYNRSTFERLKVHDKNFYGAQIIAGLLPGAKSVVSDEKHKSGKVQTTAEANALIKIVAAKDLPKDAVPAAAPANAAAHQPKVPGK